MASPRRWIRLDVSWEDSWCGELSGAAAGCWPRLLVWVKRDGSKGRCKRPRTSVLSHRWRVSVSDILEMEAAAVTDGALTLQDGDWVVTNWEEYQDTDPTATERKRQERARKAEMSRSVTNVTRDTVARPPTETERTDNYHGAGQNVEKYERPEFSHFDLLEAAKRECGMGTWPPAKVGTASGVIAGWISDGRKRGQIWDAIHGARHMVDAGMVTWLQPRQPFGLETLKGTRVLFAQGDGEAPRPFFDVAVEEFVRASDPTPAKASNGGPVRLHVPAPTMQALGGSSA